MLIDRAGGCAARLPFESEIERIPRPVVARSHEYKSGVCTEMHAHSRSQLIFAISGTMTVSVGDGVWSVPSSRAVWMPAEVEHCVTSDEPLSMRSIFVDPKRSQRLLEPCMISVSPLLRELILEAASLTPLYPLNGSEDRLMTVLLDRLEAAPSASLHLPMPVDRRLRKLAAALLKDPASSKSVHEWGREVGASARTIARLFPAETGMSFTQWQQNARALVAVRLLSTGESVYNVAQQVGYESPSAFVLMFKRIMGKTPKQYLGALSTHA